MGTTLGKWSVSYRPKRQDYCVTRYGEVVSCYYNNRSLAHARMLTMQQKEAAEARGKERNCLTCGVPFYSTGNGNRICNACKDSEAFCLGKECWGT